MYQSKRSKLKNGVVSVICTFALAFGMGMPYLAFAQDEEESLPIEMEVTDTPAPDETVVPEEGIDDVQDADAADVTDPMLDVVESDESTDDAAVSDAPEADPAETAPAATDTVTYTFIGTTTGNKEVQVEKGTVIAPDQIPTGAAASYTEYGQNIPSFFVGWSTSRMQTTSGMLDKDFCTDTYNTGWSSYSGISRPANFNTTFYPVYKVDAYAVAAVSSGEGGGDGTYYMLAKAGTVIGKDNALVQWTENNSPYLKLGQKMKGWFYGGANDYMRSTPVSFPVTVNGDLAYFNDKALICVFENPVEDTDTSTFTSLDVIGDTRVKVSGYLNGPNIPEGADVKVEADPVTSGPAFDDLNQAMGRDRIGDVFEITLLVNGQEVHDGFGTLAISMPIDPAYNGHVIFIYHRHQDGSITTTRTIAKDGYVTFSVTDLSWFAMEDRGLPEGSGLAQTGDEVSLLGLIGLISVAGGIGCYSMLNLRSRKRGLHIR